MFQSAYQDGDCVEVFSPAGKNPGSAWKSSGKVVRVFEKGVKGYVLTVTGGATSKMQLPKAPKGLLGLRQRHLVLQVLTAASQDKPFSLELGLKDGGGTRRRLVLSSSFKALHCTPLHAQIPLVGLDRHRGTWANLSIDLAELTATCFKADAFSSLELISVGPTCRLRKIFTMKDGLDDWEDGGGEDQDGPVDGATAPGPNDGGGCEPAPMAPVPVRMAFPAGVVPAPRNWVISLSTLRRLAKRNVPPPSASKRTSSAAASPSEAGRTRRSRPVPSPSQPSFRHGTSSPSSAIASLCMPGEERSVPSNRNGAKAERGTASPRFLEIVAGKPSSRSSSRASPTGLLPRHRSISSRGSSSASTRPPATPSPLATPARNSGNTPGRRDPRPTSSSSGLRASSTPGGGVSGVDVGVGLAGRGTAHVGRNGDSGTPSFRRTPSRAAAATSGSASRSVGSAVEVDLGETEGLGRRGVLPARRRMAEAYLSEGITYRMGQAGTEDGGAGGGSGRGGRKNRAPAGEWRVAGSWGEGNDGPAPAWSFLEANENYGLSSDVSRLATPKLKGPDSMESPPGSPRTELATTTTAGSYGRPILASMMGGDTCGPASGLEGDNEGLSLSALQASHEALPAEIDVGWRGAQYCDDGGAVASAERFSTTVRLRSPPGSRNDGKRASSRASPPYYTAPSNAAAGTPTALGTSGRSSPAEAIIEREGNDVRAKTPATAASLFASTFSGLGEGHQAARRSPAALDGGASHPGGRSPMSARVDVLQNILAPVEMAEDGLARPNSCVVSPAVTEGRASDEAVFAKMLTMPAPEGKGGGGGIECGEITDSSAERLLERSSETGSRNTIERHERTRPGLSNESDDIQQVGATERPQTPEAKEADDLRPISLRARSGADASTSALDGGPERKAGSRSITDELDAMEQVHFGGVKGLSRPSSYSARNGERWDKQKAGPRLTTGERFDELEELERKEIALLDLEESSHSEFGSVVLRYRDRANQSPQKPSPFTGLYSPTRDSPAATAIQTDSSSTTKTIGRSRPDEGTESPFGSLGYRQRASVDDFSNNDGDTDSVVLRSRASTASAAPGEGTVEGEPGAHAGTAKREEGVVKREARDRAGGARHGSEGGNGELYFDPVLNCYYDRVADKYYGLR